MTQVHSAGRPVQLPLGERFHDRCDPGSSARPRPALADHFENYQPPAQGPCVGSSTRRNESGAAADLPAGPPSVTGVSRSGGDPHMRAVRSVENGEPPRPVFHWTDALYTAGMLLLASPASLAWQSANLVRNGPPSTSERD